MKQELRKLFEAISRKKMQCSAKLSAIIANTNIPLHLCA